MDSISTMFRASFCLCALLVLAFRSTAFLQPIHKTRTPSTGRLFSEEQQHVSRETLEKAQFDSFSRNQIGRWLGVHTGYDPEDSMVADHMYVESNLEATPDGGIRHSNGFVMGEIRTDYEVKVEPERIRRKDVGVYYPGKLWFKSCSTVELRGPSPTPRGMSVEFCLRQGDSRVRVLLAHAPVEFVSVGKIGKVPSAMLLRDVVIVRERLNSRPLDYDENPDRMWFKTPASLLEGTYRGERVLVGPVGQLLTSPIQTLELPSVVLSEKNNNQIENMNAKHNKKVVLLTPDELEGNVYRHVYAGGVMVEVPSVISAGEEVNARVSWMPCGGVKGQRSSVIAAEIHFSALELDQMAVDSGILRLKAPTLLDYFVDYLQPV